jgi:cytoskeletal protein RodZ
MLENILVMTGIYYLTALATDLMISVVLATAKPADTTTVAEKTNDEALDKSSETSGAPTPGPGKDDDKSEEDNKSKDTKSSSKGESKVAATPTTEDKPAPEANKDEATIEEMDSRFFAHKLTQKKGKNPYAKAKSKTTSPKPRQSKGEYNPGGFIVDEHGTKFYFKG